MFTNSEISWIRNEVKNSEQTKAISEKLLTFIIDKQLFKLFLPQTLGGAMLPLSEAIRTFQHCSYIDGTFGWLVTIGSGGGMFAPNFTEQAAKVFYTPKDAVIAGSGFPAGIAKEVEGGYIVNGEWHYCSGSQYATIFTATAKTNAENDTKLLSFIFKPEQVEVIEDWNAMGLKGTSSHTIRITDQFAPTYRTFSIFKKQYQLEEPIYDFPFIPFSQASFTAIVLGIGERYMEETKATFQEKSSVWQTDRLTFSTYVLKTEAEKMNQAKAVFYQQLDSLWKQHTDKNTITERQQEAFSTCCKNTVSTVLKGADKLFRLIGMQAVKETSTINRIWRDLHTASQHAFLMPQNDADLESF
ncbi:MULTISPECIES: acyl-CoA dehydrogenase [Clostridia]|uniref:acyl-CoA dehydrogenase n=1 Tax=Clostridia TaxID=186801 RepID=UPI000EA1B041|nr:MULTISPECIES: acyl-CoA dehydrogenase [Clostridia]NBJ68176.1 acyl-CoA dehydrogenase [Roseburia sp. 1XD42-34]RKI81949.1 acyl-CoA dehydrogenase [Clostridium sp. 1xD42-85]